MRRIHQAMAGEGNQIAKWLNDELGIPVDPNSFRSVSGGCIHTARLAERLDGGHVFVKSNRLDTLSMFEAERKCLDWIGKSETIRVPKPYGTGTAGNSALLAMEGLLLESPGTRTSHSTLGEHLAAMHKTQPAWQFGAPFDNYIGATPQPNTPTRNWATFFVEKRLEFQFHLASKNGLEFSNRIPFLEVVGCHLDAQPIQPSLLHGDLWGGNVAFLTDGTPVIFDPAAYIGDAEADIAFTRFFGGFESEFYSSYRKLFPEPEPIRHEIYNLYHVLNHFNLFGGSYAHQAGRMMEVIYGGFAG